MSYISRPSNPIVCNKIATFISADISLFVFIPFASMHISNLWFHLLKFSLTSPYKKSSAGGFKLDKPDIFYTIVLTFSSIVFAVSRHDIQIVLCLRWNTEEL